MNPAAGSRQQPHGFAGEDEAEVEQNEVIELLNPPHLCTPVYGFFAFLFLNSIVICSYALLAFYGDEKPPPSFPGLSKDRSSSGTIYHLFASPIPRI